MRKFLYESIRDFKFDEFQRTWVVVLLCAILFKLSHLVDLVAGTP
jgi:hypothetical protein